MENFEYKKLYNYNSSFQLIRTNPKLTGNVKLVVDSSDDLWLSAIQVNEPLSDVKFQKRPVDVKIPFSENLYTFFKQVNVQNNDIFYNKQPMALNTQAYDYDDQYFFQHYFSSIRYANSRHYDEYFSAFAPLYIKGDVPSHYVVFRIEGALDDRLDLLNPNRTASEIFLDVLKHSKLVQSFDMSRGTKLGDFLWDIVERINESDSELQVDFKNNIVDWNGYSLNNGTLTGYSSFEPYLFEEGKPIKDFEKYIIDGYEKYGMIYPHIINLEFMFDDNASEYYDFNRYFGFYVDEIELNKIILDYDQFLKDFNTPNYDLYKWYLNYNDIKDQQITDEFVKLPISSIVGDFNLSDAQATVDTPIIPVIVDKENDLHSVKFGDGFDYNDDDILENVYINNKATNIESQGGDSVTVDDFFGGGDTFMQIPTKKVNTPGHGHTYIRVLDDLFPGDVIKIYHSRGTRDDGDGDMYDLLEAAESTTYLNTPGEIYYYIKDDTITTIPPIESNLYYFYGKGEHGTTYKVVDAIKNLINLIPYRSFEPFVNDNYLFIKMINPGDTVSVRIEFTSASGDYNSVEIYGETGNDIIGTEFPLLGNTRIASRAVISNEYVDYLSDNIDKVYVKTTNGISKIKEIVKYVDVINEKYQNYEIYNTYSVIVLENQDIPEIYNGFLYLIKEFEVPVKLLSFRNLKDFDYDFYSERYNKFPIWELYKYYSIPPETSLLEAGVYYKVVGDGVIEFNGTQYKSDNISEYSAVFQATANTENIDYFSIVSGYPVVIYSDITNTGDPILNNPLFDENDDITRFPGFFGLRDYSVNIHYNTTDEYDYSKRFFEHLLKSEYNAYRENYATKYSELSKISPYICKWGYVDGLDARDNPYRLNAHSVFGLSNISPDFTRYTADVNSLTHEWFYMISKYDFIKDDSITKLNYTHFEENLTFDYDDTETSTDFIDYFYYQIKNDDDIEIAPAHQRFSFIEYNNSTNLSETFFKGIKFVLYEDGDEYKDNNRFDKYRFTVLLQPIKETLQTEHPPFTVEFIENEPNKYIILLIKLYVGYDGLIDTTIDDVDETNYRELTSDPTQESVEGDYKLTFDGDVCDITHLFFYGVDHKKFNSQVDRYSTVKIPAYFNFIDTNANIASQIGNIEVTKMFSDYSFDLSDFISYQKPVNYLKMKLGSTYPVYLNVDLGDIGTDYNSNSPIHSTHTDNLALRKGALDKFVVTDYNGNLKGNLPLGLNPSNVTQIKGGKNYFDKIFSKLSFSQIKDLINQTVDISNYTNTDDVTTYSFGEIKYRTNSTRRNRFKVKILKPDEVIKLSDIKTKISEYKPDGYKDYAVTSYDIEIHKLPKSYSMQRYSGFYEPIFNDVLYYKASFNYKNDANAANYNPISIANVEFLVDYENFGTLPEFSHLKVSDVKILSLDTDKDSNSYEAIDEIAIGRDSFMFVKSDWDYNYHHKYISKSEKVYVPGTYRYEDDNAFINKKLFLPKDITLVEYEASIVTQNRILNVLNLEENVNYGFQSIYNTDDGIRIAFNIEEIFIKNLMDSGVWDNIQKYLPDDLTLLNGVDLFNYTKQYLSVNIVNLFDVDDVKLYVLEVTKDIPSELIIPDSTTTETELINLGYKLKKDTKINKNEITTIVINKNVNYNYKVYPFIKMKLV